VPTNRVTAVIGAPWYTSGTHMWNGTAPNLKDDADDDERDAQDHAEARCSRQRLRELGETAGCR
jgi:beta-mannanase